MLEKFMPGLFKKKVVLILFKVTTENVLRAVLFIQTTVRYCWRHTFADGHTLLRSRSSDCVQKFQQRHLISKFPILKKISKSSRDTSRNDTCKQCHRKLIQIVLPIVNSYILLTSIKQHSGKQMKRKFHAPLLRNTQKTHGLHQLIECCRGYSV